MNSKTTSPRTPLGAVAIASLVLLLSPGTAAAQAPDFMLGAPRASIGVRGTWNLARGQGDLLDFVREHLTVGDRDFDGLGFTMEFGYRLRSQVVVFGRLGTSQGKVSSEFRDFVENGDPIVQTTTLRRVPFSLGVKLHLTPLGREVSQFAWVANAVSPYVGVGGGAVIYEFTQDGDFVDFDNLEIFTRSFTDDGTAPMIEVFGGLDLRVHKQAFLNLEVGYMWSDANPGGDYEDFEKLDLTGLQIGVGVDVLF